MTKARTRTHARRAQKGGSVSAGDAGAHGYRSHCSHRRSGRLLVGAVVAVPKREHETGQASPRPIRQHAQPLTLHSERPHAPPKLHRCRRWVVMAPFALTVVPCALRRLVHVPHWPRPVAPIIKPPFSPSPHKRIL
eukprot:Opistho-1_new@57992